MAETVSLKEIQKDLKALRKEVREIRGFIEEGRLSLSEDAKKQVTESRRRAKEEFLSQDEVERKFL